jgi:hypothetical protein
MSHIETLKTLIATRGPISCVRVSSARARGIARRYPYWGAVRYVVRLRADGTPTYAAVGRAASDRRSERLAERDAEALAAKLGAVCFQAPPGVLSDDNVKVLLNLVGVEG